MANLTQRVITGTILVIIIVTSIMWNPYSFIILLLAIDLLGLLEFYSLFDSYTSSPGNIAGAILSLSILATVILLTSHLSDWRVLLINIPFAFGLFILELYLKARYPFHNLAFIFLGIICITAPLCFFTAIAFLPFRTGNYHHRLVLGYFFILWAGDTGAYFIGKYFGKRKLFERISPKKTWAGSLGGTACALLVACLNFYFFSTMNAMDWMGMALIIVVAGTFGDLVKSLMKRSLGLKDSGTILPGHGGMLDRFDTLLSSAPFVFCYLILSGNA
ncbi:MAG: phosphatidate cytidylyltransferase [Bacteroidota bacterium]|nr:phosphatidate cytidylyltransferase [Bacteroidota bacterium]